MKIMWYMELGPMLLVLVTPCLSIYQESCAGKTLLLSGGLSCDDRLVILDAHNKARQNVALGKVTGQPGASNMREMVWDEELAEVAQRWADRCTIAHDHSRDVQRFQVGQNIAATWTTRTNAGAEPDFPRQVKGWYDEVKYFNFYTTGFTKRTGHYSQLVWSETFLVGCGYSHYYDQTRGYTKLYVCNYGPGGNVIGSTPYTAGSPSCSEQDTRPSKHYQGLCEVNGYPSLGPYCASAPVNRKPYGSSTFTNNASPTATGQQQQQQQPQQRPQSSGVQSFVTYQTNSKASSSSGAFSAVQAHSFVEQSNSNSYNAHLYNAQSNSYNAQSNSQSAYSSSYNTQRQTSASQTKPSSVNPFIYTQPPQKQTQYYSTPPPFNVFSQRLNSTLESLSIPLYILNYYG